MNNMSTNLPAKKNEIEKQEYSPFQGKRISTVDDLIKFLSQYKGNVMLEGGRLLRNHGGMNALMIGASEFEMRISMKILLDPIIKEAWEKGELMIPPTFKQRDYHHVDLQIELSEDPYEKERIIVVKETEKALLICSAVSEKEVKEYVRFNWEEDWELAGSGIRMICDEDPSFNHFMFYLT